MPRARSFRRRAKYTRGRVVERLVVDGAPVVAPELDAKRCPRARVASAAEAKPGVQHSISPGSAGASAALPGGHRGLGDKAICEDCDDDGKKRRPAHGLPSSALLPMQIIA